MKILYANSGFFSLADLSLSDAEVAKDSGFSFDSASGAWQSADAESVRRLRSNSLRLSGPLTISELALQHFRAAGQEVLTAVERSKAVDSDLEIPVPSGMKLLPFQKAGIAYIVEKLRR